MMMTLTTWGSLLSTGVMLIAPLAWRGQMDVMGLPTTFRCRYASATPRSPLLSLPKTRGSDRESRATFSLGGRLHPLGTSSVALRA